MNQFFGKGRRGFAIASVLTIVIAILHTMGLANDPYDENWAAAEEAMRAATIPIGSLSTSFHKVFVGAWIQVGVLMALVGVQNLVILGAASGEFTAIRRMSIVDGVACAGLAALFAVYLVPPPLIAFTLLAVAFFVSAATARAAAAE